MPDVERAVAFGSVCGVDRYVRRRFGVDFAAMTDLPTGTVTFLFTDIEGSTRLLQRLGDEYAQLLATHREILRGAVAGGGGVEVGTEGDSIFAVFPSAVGALEATVAGQRGLGAQSWPGGVEVGVRMGLHSGEATLGPEGYVGLDVHRAARIASAAHGGQIVVSATTVGLVEQSLPDDVGLRRLGVHRLKDLADAEEIAQVVAPDLRGEFPPLRSLERVPHNLPLQLTRFVGRDQELAEVSKLLTVSRMITLTGVGGTGKTRLALQSAADVSDQFDDGVWFVELAAIADPRLVDNAVATVLGVQEQPGQSLLETLGEVLRSKQALLILDNCEHVIEACALLVEAMLRSASNVRVLATSREGLGVAGEVAYAVPSLSIPPPDASHPDELLRYDSVALFAQRAAVVRPGFWVTADNAATVAEICRRLDGIPLALELAAARSGTLSAPEIAERLDDRFRLLTGGSRTALPRQQTLAAAVSWSYDLLSDGERVLFDRLSVFSGGFTMAAAEGVCSDDALDTQAILDLVSGLVDKSMVLAERAEHGPTRYRMLETLRQYARERLVESSTSDQYRRRHAMFFAAWAQEGNPKHGGSDNDDWLQAVGVELDNVRAALAWALDAPEPVTFLELCAATAAAWEELGLWEEGRSWLSAAPVFDEAQDAGLRALALIELAELTVPDDPEAAGAPAERAVILAREAGEPGLVAYALRKLGYVNMHRYRSDESVVALNEAFALAEANDDRWGVAAALKGLGRTYTRTDPDRSIELLEQSLGIFKELGDQRRIASGLFQVGLHRVVHGETRAGLEQFRRSIDLYEGRAPRSIRAHLLFELGGAESHLEEWDRAIEHLQEGLQLLTDVGDQRCASLALRDVGLIDLHQGRIDRAEQELRLAVEGSHRVGNKMGTTLALEAMGLVAAQRGAGERAAMLFGAAAALRTDLPIPATIQEAEDSSAALQAARLEMDPETFERGRTSGSSLKMDEAVALALN